MATTRTEVQPELRLEPIRTARNPGKKADRNRDEVIREIAARRRRTLTRDIMDPVTIALTIGTSLAISALVVRENAKRAEARHPAAGRFVEAFGARIHYLEQGNGPAVVLLHGNGVLCQDFAGCGLFDSLAPRYRVIAIDRPGFGYSERPDTKVWSAAEQALLLREVFHKLEIERPIVLAHSWATLVALELALIQSEAVKGLVLVSGYYYPAMRWEAIWKSPPALPFLGTILRNTISPLLGHLLTPIEVRQLFAPDPVPASFHRNVPLEMMLRPGQLRAAAAETAMMMSGARALHGCYAHLNVPVSILAGAEDRVVDHQNQSVRLHEELPYSRLELFPGRGHMLHYSETERIVRLINSIADERATQTVEAAQS